MSDKENQDLELCPKCKEGHLRPIGKDSVSGESKGEFRQRSSTRELKCDKCGHRQVNVGLNEFVE